MSTPTTMRANVESYLAYRRTPGFALRIAGQQLLSFARLPSSPAIRANNAGSYRSLDDRLAQPSTLTAARRIEVLRPFARYCQQLDRQPKSRRYDFLVAAIAD